MITRTDIQLFTTLSKADALVGLVAAEVNDCNITIRNVTTYSYIKTEVVKKELGFMLGKVTGGYHYIYGLNFDLNVTADASASGFYASLDKPINVTFANILFRNTSVESKETEGGLAGKLTGE